MKTRFLTIISVAAMAMMFNSCDSDPSPKQEPVIRPVEVLSPVFKAGYTEICTPLVKKYFTKEECDGSLVEKWSWAPGATKSFTTLGPKADLRDVLDLKPGEYLAAVDTSGRTKPVEAKPKPVVHKTEPSSGGGMDFGWAWYLLELFIVVFIVALVALVTLRAIRGLLTWAFGPTSRRNNSDEQHDVESETEESLRTSFHSEVHNYWPDEPNLVRFRDAGPDPMKFMVRGNFDFPLEVKIQKGKEPATTVTFGRPTEGDQPEEAQPGS